MGFNQAKILILLGSSTYGGGERYSLDLVRSKISPHKLVLGLPENSILIPYLKENKIAYLPLKFPKGFFGWREFYTKIYEFDLIHAQLNLAAKTLSFLSPFLKPWIATMHGFSSNLFYMNAKKIICVSNALKDSLPKSLQKKSLVIYNGIEEQSKQKKQMTKELKVYTFATIHPNKGQQFVINSLKNWYDRPKNLSIYFIGTGNKKYVNQIQQSLKDISFIKHIPYQGNLKAYWEQANFVLIPSFKETLSYVALEAQNQGVPILYANTGGLSESALPWGGVGFKKGDSKSLRLGLLKMLKEENNYRQKLRLAPLLEQCPQFKLNTMLEKVNLLWSEML